MEIIDQFIVNDICVDRIDCVGDTNTFIALKICENLTYKSYYIRNQINAFEMFEYKPTHVDMSIYVSGNIWSQHDMSYFIYKRYCPQI